MSHAPTKLLGPIIPEVDLKCLIHNQILNVGSCDHDPLTSTYSWFGEVDATLPHVCISSLMMLIRYNDRSSSDWVGFSCIFMKRGTPLRF